MSSQIIKNSGHTAYGLKEYVVDTLQELNNLSIDDPQGSLAIVINGGNLKHYMMNGNHEWTPVSYSESGGGGGSAFSPIIISTELTAQYDENLNKEFFPEWIITANKLGLNENEAAVFLGVWGQDSMYGTMILPDLEWSMIPGIVGNISTLAPNVVSANNGASLSVKSDLQIEGGGRTISYTAIFAKVTSTVLIDDVNPSSINEVSSQNTPSTE